MRLVRYCLISILIAVAPWAKAQMVGGTISGDVVDPAGSAVAQAEVLIRNDETGSERKFVTAESGTFGALGGRRRVYRFRFPGWVRPSQPYRSGAYCWPECPATPYAHRGKCAAIRVRGGYAATVDTSTLQNQGLVGERQVKELPLNGRSYDQLIELNPAAVSYTTQRSGGVGTSNSSVGNMFRSPGGVRRTISSC